MGFWSRRAERRKYADDPTEVLDLEPDAPDDTMVFDEGPDLVTRLTEIHDEQKRQEAFIVEAFGDEPEDTDPNGADLASEPVEPEPVILPRGAVVNKQDVYAGGNRCGNCRKVTTLEVCVNCTTAGYVDPPKCDEGAYDDVMNDREPYDWSREPVEAFVPEHKHREQWMYPRDGGDDAA